MACDCRTCGILLTARPAYVYQKLWSDDVRFLRYDSLQIETDKKSDTERWVPRLKTDVKDGQIKIWASKMILFFYSAFFNSWQITFPYFLKVSLSTDQTPDIVQQSLT